MFPIESNISPHDYSHGTVRRYAELGHGFGLVKFTYGTWIKIQGCISYGHGYLPQLSGTRFYLKITFLYLVKHITSKAQILICLFLSEGLGSENFGPMTLLQRSR